MSERTELSQSEDRTFSPASSAYTEDDRRQTGSDKRVSTGEISREDLEKIAEKVYRMMRRDLMLERERATKIGG